MVTVFFIPTFIFSVELIYGAMLITVVQQNDSDVCVCVCVLCVQSCPVLHDPMDCSPPGSSVHGILQARILDQVAISFSRGSFQPRDETWVSSIAGGSFTI